MCPQAATSSPSGPPLGLLLMACELHNNKTVYCNTVRNTVHTLHYLSRDVTRVTAVYLLINNAAITVNSDYQDDFYGVSYRASYMTFVLEFR